VDARRAATALQVLAAVDTDLAAATTQRERVIRLRDVYLPKATQARDTVDYAYRRGGASLLDGSGVSASVGRVFVRDLPARG